MSYAAHQQAASAEAPRCGVITLSDTRTPETDKSGDLISKLTTDAGFTVADRLLLPDQPSELHAALEAWLDRKDIDVILTNGGTGITRRDLTIHTIEALLETKLPGFGE
ncbi:MAG: molybdenum cofactor synthesis domain, partial [Phycisphaerales bacterium]|nr:molybdenum cofactor synthesis domain [Phycisphaerales bacterium]